ncbi:unnamed protein product [Rotaria sp. Silwood1]|nr:unnamed protein product [Rotaria sp. Silwood1]CAF3427640.1 unnamed protein product [Rotaria sp. Silwood1]CAF3446610.1 unnamed protein product [Rotaria sp. Silwood1]CAF3480308.1 unnamed protein product [Rotaria sp. Silwood1]CAF4527857.1 unnamed protein product [Rotaria sp. Silwood1]
MLIAIGRPLANDVFIDGKFIGILTGLEVKRCAARYAFGVGRLFTKLISYGQSFSSQAPYLRTALALVVRVAPVSVNIEC